MKKYVAAIVAIFLVSCALQVPPGWDYQGFTHPETFQSPAEAVRWVSDNMTYKVSPLWQTPEQTYQLRTGDCADYSLLAMYFLHEMGVDTELLEINNGEYYHALVHDLTDNVIWDVQGPAEVTITDPGIIVRTRSYREAMYMAVTIH
jgi:hypothetical protein